MKKTLLYAIVLCSTLHAEDAPKPPTVEELQQQLATKEQQIAALEQQLQVLGQRHDNVFRALTGCIGPLPQSQPALNPTQQRMLPRGPKANQEKTP